MDSQPPNNNNNNGSSNHGGNRKEVYEGSNRRGQRRRVNQNGQQAEGEVMDVFGGDLRDEGPMIALFLMGVISYMFRSRYCTC
mmetsp:Transcript_453/g.547  ORF Transcript_453/g.547 Transcript_453/m.547 type:complete len:83 (+) Transcript_453:165-413(+)|eukprot:CAMPEP_0178947322 /NCGR_PEP_ID=MMETSP0789-20121207/4789_1 /TAXON_ID=3005 /ORGANISM="Rhizosolenia setigera, Strain CCMP 1694" /LENGTH=82 /DNA_ID=CAMNT_0020627437 /DNA_START=152 /DNA_END=400 /DNA_ORIENTATION=+